MQVTNYDATSQWHLALNPFGGNIGINTHDPSYQLHICKHVGQGGDSTLCVQEIGGAEFIIKAAGTGTVIGHKTAKHLWFTRDVDAGSGSADMVITNEGYVGIGQGDPASAQGTNGVLDISHISQTSIPLTLTNYNKTTGETTAIRWRHMDPDNDADYRPVEIGTLTWDASNRHTTFFIAVADADNVDQSTDKRLAVTNSGKVGIGSTPSRSVLDPSHQLHVKTAGAHAAIAIQTDGFPTWVPSFLYYRGDTLEFGTRVDDVAGVRTWSVYDHVADTYRFSVDGSGGVAFGPVGGGGGVDFGAGITIKEGGHPGAYPADTLIMDYTAGPPRRAGRFFSTGDSQNPGGFQWYTAEENGVDLTLVMEINGGGTAIEMPALDGASTGTQINWTSGVLHRFTSSKKYKKNIVDLDIDTSKIFDLRPVSFNDKATDQRCFGLIAEEVYEEMPELVVLENEEPDAVTYSTLSVLLLAEVKKLRARVEQLEAKMAQQI